MHGLQRFGAAGWAAFNCSIQVVLRELVECLAYGVLVITNAMCLVATQATAVDQRLSTSRGARWQVRGRPVVGLHFRVVGVI